MKINRGHIKNRIIKYLEMFKEDIADAMTEIILEKEEEIETALKIIETRKEVEKDEL